jgi:triosephosphate isomerase (TIM)
MSPHRVPVIAGNWKLHHGPAAARRFVDAFLPLHVPRGDREVAIFPTSIALAAVRDALAGRSDIALGVQNVYWEAAGAFTGEISAGLAREAGASLALIGHSERRHVFGESTDDTVRKLRAVLDAGLRAVLCVGETLEERRAGRENEVVEGQLRPTLDVVGVDEVDRVIIAYEPVWAIGTGETATPADAAAMHAHVRGVLSASLGADAAGATRILYGGSVKPANAAELLAAADVDGLLVGGASLEAESFAAICNAAA